MIRDRLTHLAETNDEFCNGEEPEDDFYYDWDPRDDYYDSDDHYGDDRNGGRDWVDTFGMSGVEYEMWKNEYYGNND